MELNEYLVLVGNNIRRLRKERKMTQRALADMCDMHRSNFYRVEAGTENLTISTLLKIAEALEVEVSEIFILK